MKDSTLALIIFLVLVVIFHPTLVKLTVGESFVSTTTEDKIRGEYTLGKGKQVYNQPVVEVTEVVIKEPMDLIQIKGEVEDVDIVSKEDKDIMVEEETRTKELTIEKNVASSNWTNNPTPINITPTKKNQPLNYGVELVGEKEGSLKLKIYLIDENLNRLPILEQDWNKSEYINLNVNIINNK